MRSGHVPVEVLGLQIQGKSVGEQRCQGAGDVGDGIGAEIVRCAQRHGPHIVVCHYPLPLYSAAGAMDAIALVKFGERRSRNAENASFASAERTQSKNSLSSILMAALTSPIEAPFR